VFLLGGERTEGQLVNVAEQSVQVQAGAVVLDADVAVPETARGVVLFAHGSGSGRHSPRNRGVAAELQRAGRLATVLADLLTRDEERRDAQTGEFRFAISLLAERVIALIDWAGGHSPIAALPLGLFGASTGAGAALVAAGARPSSVAAVVSRGGRPDLAGAALASVRQPTLLIVGSRDTVVLDLNRQALDEIAGEVRLAVVPDATHLFEEPGALGQVAQLATDWFLGHLGTAGAHR
jgi:dienelactone hydrolase